MTTYAREQDLLGWMMTRQSFPEELMDVQDKWFSDRLHGQIFKTIRKLLESECLAVPPDVADMLNRDDPINPSAAEERCDYVWALVKNSGPMNLHFTIKALREHGKRHEMKLALLAAVNEMEDHETFDEALSAALGHIDGIALKGVDKGLLTGHDLNLYGVRWLQERNERHGELPGLPTGIPDLDNIIFGLKPGELITIAGASGMGKTTMATNIVEHIANGWSRADGSWEDGKNVLIISREMGETQIALRHFSSQGGVNSGSLQRGVMTDSEWIALEAAMPRIEHLKVFYDLDSKSPQQVALRARQLKRKLGSLGMIMVDQLSLMRSDKQRGTRKEEVADITWGFKTLARDLNIPVVQLSQIVRDVKNRADKRPQLTDMSDSKSIEDDSDVVIGMYRDEYYNKDSMFKGLAEAIVLKNRMGECKSVPLVYQGQFSRFRPCDMGAWVAACQQADESSQTKQRFNGGFKS